MKTTQNDMIGPDITQDETNPGNLWILSIQMIHEAASKRKYNRSTRVNEDEGNHIVLTISPFVESIETQQFSYCHYSRVEEVAIFLLDRHPLPRAQDSRPYSHPLPLLPQQLILRQIHCGHLLHSLVILDLDSHGSFPRKS